MRKIFILSLFVILVQLSNACDICGCSHGGYFVGMFPDFKRHFLGLRYSFRNYYSHIDTSAEFSKDHYQTLELWTGFNIGKRWQLMVFLPFNANKQKTDDGGHAHTHDGFGDLTLIANYQLLQKEKHQVWAGAGIKLPTGKFKPEDDNELVPAANMEPGSGSTDFLLTATDIIQFGQWNVYSNANYTINREAMGFRFGNRLNASVLFARSIEGKKTVIIPNAGFYYENLASNKQSSQKIGSTGGQALSGSAGIDIRFGKMNVGMNVQLPVAQNFSAKQTEAKTRGMLQVIYMF
jgi:hypothetical protein